MYNLHGVIRRNLALVGAKPSSWQFFKFYFIIIVRNGARFKNKLIGVMVYFKPMKNKQQSVSCSFPQYKIIMMGTYENHVSKNTQL